MILLTGRVPLTASPHTLRDELLTILYEAKQKLHLRPKVEPQWTLLFLICLSDVALRHCGTKDWQNSLF